MIQNVTSANSTAAATATAATGATSGADVQDRFLKLLVAQMKNQDPMSPMDNAQVTAQMAQISTVSGINQTNQTLSTLLGQFSGLATVQGAALAGRDVVVPGNALALSGGAGTAGFELSAAADHVVVTIQDASGRAVHKVDLGASVAGMQSFQWDGMTDAGQQAADGNYTFKVEATSAGAAVASTTLSQAKVQGVINAASGLQLDLGALGVHAFSDVKRIQ